MTKGSDRVTSTRPVMSCRASFTSSADASTAMGTVVLPPVVPTTRTTPSRLASKVRVNVWPAVTAEVLVVVMVWMSYCTGMYSAMVPSRSQVCVPSTTLTSEVHSSGRNSSVPTSCAAASKSCKQAVGGGGEGEGEGEGSTRERAPVKATAQAQGHAHKGKGVMVVSRRD